jgi:glycosyltransferase involved in cell wall biosynthesis
MNDLGQLRYAIVSPVKDEEKYVARTIRSVLNQTVKPVRWVIVDDGSRDRTPEIVASATRGIDWIDFVRIDRDGKRELGITEIRAFGVGYERLRNVSHDLIVKLDCDVELQPAYFEEVLERFARNPRLGIASGAFLEEHAGKWTFIRMPGYHASGASKVVRAECFRQIGGFVYQKGWDTVDEIRARALGWETERFQDLTFLHLKREGSASGFVYSSLLEGEIDYATGSSKAFFLLKSLHRMATRRPRIAAGALMMWGFLRPLLQRRPRLVSDAEAKLYRGLLNGRMRDGFRRLVRLRKRPLDQACPASD